MLHHCILILKGSQRMVGMASVLLSAGHCLETLAVRHTMNGSALLMVFNPSGCRLARQQQLLRHSYTPECTAHCQQDTSDRSK